MAQSAVDGLRVSDIGGLPLRDGQWFRSGLVFRISGGMVGPAELAHLDAIGLRVLVDLRGPDEDRSALEDWAQSRGVRYEAAADLVRESRRPRRRHVGARCH